MNNIVKKFPAISQFIFALTLGTCVVILVNEELIPKSLMILGALSASIAGVVLTAIVTGKSGLRQLFDRIIIWRINIGWWAFAVFAVLIVVVLGMLSNAFFNLDILDLTRIFNGLDSIVPVFVMIMIMGGLGEELGWRGFMLPRLQTRYNALVSSIIVGVLHGLWHVPMFFIEGLSPYQEMAAASNIVVVIIGYTIFYITPWAILYTCLLNNTRGSLLLVCVLHAGEAWVLTSWNIDNTIGFIGLSVGMTILSVIVLIIYGPKNLSHKNERYIIKDN